MPVQILIEGCSDVTAINYSPDATIDDGSCINPVYGCTNPHFCNYDQNAEIDDGSCTVYQPEISAPPYTICFNGMESVSQSFVLQSILQIAITLKNKFIY